jgi:membrane fusion protein (multidrug efflux system)
MEAQGVDVPQLEIHVELSNRQLYPLGGRIDYVSNRVDENTGTIEARASIPNPNGELRPGQYVKVLVELPMAIDTLMIPQAAVQADQQGSFVLVVGPDNIVRRQNVELDDRVNDKVVVKQGLEDGDRVIVRGLQKVRPGQPVKTKEMPSDDTSKEA